MQWLMLTSSSVENRRVPPEAEKQWLIQWVAKERYPYTTVDRVDSGKNYPNVGVVGLLRLDGLFTDASYDSLESAPNIF